MEQISNIVMINAVCAVSRLERLCKFYRKEKSWEYKNTYIEICSTQYTH